MSSVVQSIYSSALSGNSSIYMRTGCGIYYYEAIQVNVNETGTYSLLSSSNIDTYGFIYKNSFNPANPSMNQLSQNDNGCGNNQFNLTAQLQSNTTYILVVTTSRPGKKGAFSIVVSGLGNVSLKPISEYISTTL